MTSRRPFSAVLTAAALGVATLGATLPPVASAGSAAALLPATAASVKADDVTGPARAEAVDDRRAALRRASRAQERGHLTQALAGQDSALAAELASLERQAMVTQAVTEARAAALTEAKAAAARAAAVSTTPVAGPVWVAPVPGAGLSAGFGERSFLWRDRHTGQDFTAPTGTPVHVIGDGVVISAGWDGPYGLIVRVRHADGTESWYAHLSAIVRGSGRVRAGDVIGRVGSTGNTTGPHLHLEIHPGGGDPVDPLAWLRLRHVIR